MEIIIVSISGKYNRQHFWKLQLLTFLEVIIANISAFFNCQQFWKLNLSTFLEIVIATFQKIIFANIFENHIC